MLPVMYVANVFLLDEPLFYTFFLLQNAFYIFAIIGAILRRGRIRSRVFFIPFYFVMVNAAALAAIMTYTSGGRLSSWEKVETTRDMEDHHLEIPRLRVIEGKKKGSRRAEKVNKIT